MREGQDAKNASEEESVVNLLHSKLLFNGGQVCSFSVSGSLHTTTIA